jgi:hypothetical protein
VKGRQYLGSRLPKITCFQTAEQLLLFAMVKQITAAISLGALALA